ncbi:hypothetical protein SUDANB58_01379 [Streptomyces sp. enrichment culture]
MNAAGPRGHAVGGVPGRGPPPYVPLRLERRADAPEQPRPTGPYAASFPRGRDADDPLGRFPEVRRGVRAAVASAPVAAGSGRPRYGHGARVRCVGH